MAKKTGAKRTKVEDLKVKDVETAEAHAVTGGKASFQDFNFTHKYDKASPVLMAATA